MCRIELCKSVYLYLSCIIIFIHPGHYSILYVSVCFLISNFLIFYFYLLLTSSSLMIKCFQSSVEILLTSPFFKAYFYIHHLLYSREGFIDAQNYKKLSIWFLWNLKMREKNIWKSVKFFCYCCKLYGKIEDVREAP